MLNKWGQFSKAFQDVSNKSENLAGENGLISASSSRMLTNYEISDDLTRVHLQYLERKYGGRLRAHAAATKIQRCYRHYRLCQQWRHVLNQAPTSSRCRKEAKPVFEPMKHTPKQTERNAHIRKLTQSQPSLKYQPTTSLRAQLRAERRDIISPPVHLPKIEFVAEKNDPSIIFVESDSLKANSKFLMQSKKRPFLELMSPRLSNRRIISSIHQPKVESVKTIEVQQQLAPTTILLYDSENEEFEANKTVFEATEKDTASGYHRSASPHLQYIFMDGTNTTMFDANSVSQNINNNNNNGLPCLLSSAGVCGSRLDSVCRQNLQKLHLPMRTVCMSRPIGTICGGSHRNESLPHIFSTTTNGLWPSSLLTQNGEVGDLSQKPRQPSSLHFSPQHNFMQRRPTIATSAVGCVPYNTSSLPRVNYNVLGKDSSTRQEFSTMYYVPSTDASRGTERSSSATRHIASSTSSTSVAVANSVESAGAKNLTNYQHLQKVERNLSQEQQQRYRIPPQMRGWTEQQRRRLYRIGLNFFNKKPDRGLHLLITWGYVHENPQAIARFFLERRGLSKQMIGEFLGTIKSPFHFAILECFVSEISMYGMDIDMALRQLLKNFRLPGEAQKIDHIMQVFARRYRLCNPDRLPSHISADTVYILAFAIIMLNTDLHTPSLKDSRRMKLDEFVKNIFGIEEGQHLNRKTLHGIYERVKEFEFRAGSDHVTQVMKVDQSIIGKDKPKLVEPHRRLICYCRLHQVVDSNKKQMGNAHQREVYLFNDLMLIGKLFSKKKTVPQHTLRYWTSLIGLRVEAFQNLFYNYGLVINCPDGQDLIFNAKNDEDRFHFMADLRESVAEATEMEQLRIELELDKQNGGGKTLLGSNWFAANGTDSNGVIKGDITVTAQRDSGLPDIDQPPISSSSSCTLQVQKRGSTTTTTIGDKEYVEDEEENLHLDILPLGLHNLSADLPCPGETPNTTELKASSAMTRFRCFNENKNTPKGILTNESILSSTASASTSLVTFNSLNSVTSSSSSAGYAGSNNGAIGIGNKISATSIALRRATTDDNNAHGSPISGQGSSLTTNVSTISVNVGSLINNNGGVGVLGLARGSRRLSFNSLDSGMVEEGVDYSV